MRYAFIRLQEERNCDTAVSCSTDNSASFLQISRISFNSAMIGRGGEPKHSNIFLASVVSFNRFLHACKLV